MKKIVLLMSLLLSIFIVGCDSSTSSNVQAAVSYPVGNEKFTAEEQNNYKGQIMFSSTMFSEFAKTETLEISENLLSYKQTCIKQFSVDSTTSIKVGDVIIERVIKKDGKYVKTEIENGVVTSKTYDTFNEVCPIKVTAQ